MSELFERLKLGDSLVTAFKDNTLSQCAAGRGAADTDACTDATTAGADADGVKDIIVGLQCVVFPDVARAVGAGVGLDVAGVAEGHANLVFVKPDSNFAATDEAFFGRSVAVELRTVLIDTLAGRGAAADEGDGERAKHMGDFHDRLGLKNTGLNLRLSSYRIDGFAPAKCFG